ncbi:MAG TPA: DUF6702 family protein [Flavitalea sp.]|nr:DUF6702 family protein [Flavitalea sp.]
MATLLFKWLFVIAGFLPGTVESTAPDFMHPFFVSVTELNHNAADKNLEISCRIFTEDFETTLVKAYHTKVDLVKPANKEAIDKIIADYIKKHIQVKLDGKIVTLEYVGFEREQESVWSYFQVSNTSAPHKIEITNNILYDAFNQQINIMHMSVNGVRKSTRLSYPEVNAKFEF